MAAFDGDGDSALVWQGPVWRIGPEPVFGAGAPGWPRELDLLTAGDDDLAELPAAVVVRLDQTLAPLARLARAESKLPVEVPALLLCGAGSAVGLPLRRSHGLVDADIPEASLFRMICARQRAILRSDEARIRRLVFGRVPSYGSAPHQQGGSSLLVAGLGRRFIELFDARARNVDLIGALSADMAENYLSQRAFDAVIIEAGIDDSLDLVERIRRDARFSQIPVLAFAEDRQEVAALFEMGANDVLHGDLTRAMLSARIASAIRMGKRRRLADRLLAESRVWLLRQAGEEGLPMPLYQAYLHRSADQAALRGLMLDEVRLSPEADAANIPVTQLAGDLSGTILSIADATSREEDLICYVAGRGPVAVLKHDQAGPSLKRRINAILGSTLL